jgi:RNA polymerase sigma-70 factor (ECF subfamily)
MSQDQAMSMSDEQPMSVQSAPRATPGREGERPQTDHLYGKRNGGRNAIIHHARASEGTLTERAGLRWRATATRPDILSAEDRRWVDGLSNSGEGRERTCRDLHVILLRAAKFEVARRRSAHHVGLADLDDIACQAASDALLRIIRKAHHFRGDSKFTTWATRFVGFEVRAKLRQHVSRNRTVGLGPEHDEQLVEPNSDPHLHAEAHELVGAIHGVVNDRFSAHQRTVFLALLMCDVTPADLGLQMGLSANAIYQIAFRARHCLRRELRANGFLD